MPESNGLIELLKKGLNTAKVTACEFLSLDKGLKASKPWPMWRNIIGASLVILPEVPTYFIPAFNQAKATGNAKELKKGEGPRGLITGGLEGVAVGAITSGREIDPRKLVPFIILGAAMQFVSSKVFPIVGENLGKIIYKHHLKQGKVILKCENTQLNKADVNLTKQTTLNVVSPATQVATAAPVVKTTPIEPTSNLVSPFKGINTNKIVSTGVLKV